MSNSMSVEWNVLQCFSISTLLTPIQRFVGVFNRRGQNSTWFSVPGYYTVIRIGRIHRLSLRYQKEYLKSTFCSNDLLSQKFTVLARRLYGQFYESFFVGRDLGTGKSDTQGPAHVHSRVINNENTCFEFFSIAKCIDLCTPKDWNAS